MTFKSDLMGIPVIERADAVAIGANLAAGYEQRDRAIDPEAVFAKPFTIKKLSRSDIKERAKDREESGSRTYDILQQAGIKPLNQGSTSSCWCQAATDCVQIARVLSGAPHVPLSPASVCSPVTGYRDVGGWPLMAIKYGALHGWCPQLLWPPNSINKRYDTDESRAARARYRIAPDGWIDLPKDDWDSVFTCLALGFPCTLAHMEWAHAVTAIDIGIASNGELLALCRNSGYGRDNTGHCWVRESFGLPDDALAITTVIGG